MRQDLRQRLARLTPEQRERLLQDMRTERVKRRAEDVIRPVDRDRPLPLSFAQARMWFLDQLAPGLPLYNTPLAMRLRGPLDRRALIEALNAVAARHEVLRTRYVGTEDGPRQVIDPAGPVALETLELGACDEAERGPRALKVAAAAGSRPFDLARGPLVRGTLARFTDDDHVFVLAMHHIVLDSWSVPLLMRELSECYLAIKAGFRPAQDPLPVQCADYAIWQRERLSGGGADADLDYWRHRLADLTVLEFPTDRPRPVDRTWLGENITAEYPAELQRGLTALADRAQVRLLPVMVAGFSALLSRYTNQHDIALGSVFTGRSRPEIEPLIGYFANTVVLRTDTSGDPSFLALLARADDAVLGAHSHQDLPFDQLVENLGIERDPARNPLFQFALYQADADRSGSRLGDVRVDELPVDLGASRFDVGLGFSELPAGGLHLNMEFSSELFDRPRTARLLDHYRRVLASAVARPDSPLSELEVMSPAEREQVVVRWNDTGRDWSVRTVCDAFQATVATAGDAPALGFGDLELSFAELNARANRLAHFLISRGAGPERRVALAMGRNDHLVVSILAVLKSGAAYMPVDLEYPAERIAFMLADTDPVLLVTTAVDESYIPDATATATATGTGTGTGIERIVLDSEETSQALRNCPATDPTDADRIAALDPAHPAYVLYTSGSSGKPKGVIVEHRCLVNLLDSQRRRVYDPATAALGRPLRTAHVLALSFDGSWEGMLWMLAGHSLYLVDDETRRDPAATARLMIERRVDAMTSTPSFAEQLIGGGVLDDEAHCPSVLSFGGEQISEWMWQRLRTTPGLRAFNVYGPTEATVLATIADFADSGHPVIGRPVDNVRAYVLDSRLRPLPIGVPGELFLAGAGVARGYLNQPGLTADRFLPDPAGGPGTRMYRTGDRARWNAEGNLEFLGRNDDQVKIRGFRIELGEIETALVAHEGVAQATVTTFAADGAQDERLVAYVVPQPGTVLEQAALRAHIVETLPEHMMPAAIIELPALPLTVNDKLDHKALPAPDFARAPDSRPPRTERERMLCELFADLLGLPEVGMDDNFFQLGGHSLLATRLISKVRSVFGVELPVRSLFEAPTAAGLLGRVDAARGAREPVRPMPRPDRIPLSYGQRRLWVLNQLDTAGAAYNMPMALRLSGALDRPALQAALADVVARHEVLRTVLPEIDGEPYQRIVDMPAAEPVIPTRTARATELPELISDAAGQGFDLTVDLPLRPHLYQLGPDEHVLVLVIHHIAGDAWSAVPLARDLSLAYVARTGGTAPDWTPLPVQYADYALWQRELIGAEADPDSVAAQQLAYWSRTLAGLPEELTLPTDRPRPVATGYQGELVDLNIDGELHARLLDVARSHDVTLFMVLQAALAGLLTRLGAGDDIPIGTPVAGRTDETLDDLIGFFLNTLVLRTDTSNDPTFSDLLARVRETDLTAYAHQDVPFEQLVDRLKPARSLARHPLFQVSLMLHNNEEARFELPGLRIGLEPVGTRTTKFDLTLSVSESRDTAGAPSGISGVLDFATDLFDRVTVEAMAGWLVGFLDAVAADPGLRIGAVDLLDAEERRTQLVRWNDTEAEVPQNRWLTDLFEEQAARTPDATAVRSGDTALTYRELNTRANRLARRLLPAGVGAEPMIALLLPRGVDLLAGLLAVLKSGAAYIPLDAGYPADRIDHMLTDAAPALVLTTTEYAGLLPRDVPALCLDAADDIHRLPGENLTDQELPGGRNPEHAAYVIYTSGSTGRPKGVVISHGALLNLLLAMRDTTRIGCEDVLVAVTTIAFDIATVEMYLPLLVGGSIVIADHDVVRDPVELPKLLADSGATIMQATPSLYQAMVTADPGAFRGMSLLVGGEALPADLAGRLTAVAERVVNCYGPTETTVWSSLKTLTGTAGTPSIGTPVSNTRMYVLDDALRPVPVGVPGRLYIAGDGVARGYLHQPALTAERFVVNPFGPAGSRMYDTGDQARWTRDGELHFLGRADHQVKLRGFRIEPGEIQAVLSRHASVAEAVVILREDRPGVEHLVGYVVAAPDAEVDLDRLRAHAHLALPDYMVPAALVVLPELPLTPNRKLDRKALPAPEFTSGGRQPRTIAERALCALFAEVLGVAEVGIDDDFFALGGHSLLAARLAGRARRELGVEVTIRALFEAPTVAGLSDRSRGGDRAGEFPVLLRLRAGGSDAPLFCVHPAAGISWGYVGLLRHLDPDRAVYGLQSRGLTEHGWKPASTADMASQYIEEIRKVQPEGPYHLLGWSFGGLVAHDIAVRLQEDGQQVASLTMLDSYPFIDDAGPVQYDDPELLAAVAGSLGYESAAEGLLADFGDDGVQALAKVFADNVNLQRHFAPRVFDGDVLFFAATEERPPGSPEAAAWQPFVTGRIEIHPIAEAHGALTRPIPMAEIGPVLSVRLKP
ncbi:amino acid adenylation domain-containing protein [Streptomyces sp. NBC_01142]|uniref:amino acid adenylation domain-containing protein n=1 Tax=Streptomyces sp. NBC_01142 TaxID=2975865 RepID=UPI002251408E|nr:non-ribosomal peptide synthetase [Streptomyces sp. NBC_01142]MCX4820787.1 amino acid adenylation domain-containing protein [Streptomyces sp. NBC_01142]